MLALCFVWLVVFNRELTEFLENVAALSSSSCQCLVLVFTQLCDIAFRVLCVEHGLD